MKRVLVNFDAAGLRGADAVAKREGVSRSEAVRRTMAQTTDPHARTETPTERQARIRAAFEGLREAGRRIKAENPGWDPIALIRASRDGKIRL